MSNITAFPTKSGNRFEAFKLYEFTPATGGYITTIEGADRFDSLDGRTSAHLYGRDNNTGTAGRFEIAKGTRQQAVMPYAYAIAAIAGLRVWLSADKTFGFYECRDGHVRSIGSEFGVVHESGCYRPINRAEGRQVGNGYRDNTATYSIDKITAEHGSHPFGAPRWAVGSVKVRPVSVAEYLTEYACCGFTEINPFGDRT